MTREERNESIKKYIIEKLNSLYGVHFSQEKIDTIINTYINQEGTLEEIQQNIDKQFANFILNSKKEKQEIDDLKKQIKQSPKSNPYFGQVYKTYIIHIFSIYEEIINSNMSEKQKRAEFESKLANYLTENKDEMISLMCQQTTDKRLIDLAPTELHRGADTLNFDSVKNLYDTFIKDVNIVSNDYEGKMYCTVSNNQQIFEEPILDDSGNVRINPDIKYNFDMIKEVYDFAQKHGKQIKFHTFLWHAAIPENLRSEIDSVTDPDLKRKMALAFLQNYASNLANFISENGYNLRQLEALNEIASDRLEEGTLRDSWWKDIIGNNPENGDEYYIDVLKIIRQNFPNTEILYNEYNEYIEDKNGKICSIIKYVKAIEQRDGVTLLDGIGLQAHYTDYLRGQQRPLSAIDIIRSAINLQRTCGDKKIYITEFDFLDFKKNGTREQLEQIFIETYSKISNGFITWGNSDSLTWYHCVDSKGKPMNAHIINSDGIRKEIYEQYKQAFLEYSITFEQIGQITTRDFTSNPEEAMGAIEALETGVKIKEKKGLIQGEE